MSILNNVNTSVNTSVNTVNTSGSCIETTGLTVGTSTHNATLSECQKRCAELLVTKDIHGKNNNEIAEECHIDRATLYRWKRQELFIQYMNGVAETFHKSFLAETYTELRNIMFYGETQHKLKAIELMLRNQGRLTDKQEVTATVQTEVNVNDELAKLGLL